MKKLTLIIAVFALLTAPALAGPPAQTSTQLRQKLTELKKEKAAAMSHHVLEAELMKEVKRGSQPPATKTDSRLADRKQPLKKKSP